MNQSVIPAGGTSIVPNLTPAGGAVSTSMPSASALAQRKAAQTVVATAPRSEVELQTAFATEMAQQNMSASDIAKAIAWHTQAQAREHASETELDRQDNEACTADLRKAWGGAYADNRRAAIAAFKLLPPVVQSMLETGQSTDGSLGMNSPAAWLWLLSQKDQRAPTAGGHQPKSVEIELAEILHVMRTDFPRYQRDPAMKSRYLQLLNAQETGTAAPPLDQVAAEIAQIEGLMRTDRKRYNADARMQARLRELYTIRGSK